MAECLASTQKTMGFDSPGSLHSPFAYSIGPKSSWPG